MEKTFDVVHCGEGMVEFNQTSAGQPAYLRGFGGDTSNAVIAAARAGARCAYLTRVGEDGFGSSLLSLWREEGIDTAGIETDASYPTGVYFVTHGSSGHEFSYLRAGSAASRMSPAWLRDGAAQDRLRTSKILHVSGISMAISASACDTVFAAMQLARDAGALVSFDANLRLRLWPLARARACIAEAVAMSDIFLPSLEDAMSLRGLDRPEEIIDWGHALGAKAVVLKLGRDGALASDGTRRERIAGRPANALTPPAPATASPAICWRAWRRAQACLTPRAMPMRRRPWRFRASVPLPRCPGPRPSKPCSEACCG